MESKIKATYQYHPQYEKCKKDKEDENVSVKDLFLKATGASPCFIHFHGYNCLNLDHWNDKSKRLLCPKLDEPWCNGLVKLMSLLGVNVI